MEAFRCACSNPLHFENSLCLQCRWSVGYDPAAETMVRWNEHSPLTPCANGTQYQVCNWLVPKNKPETYCLACQCNRTIPETTSLENRQRWSRMEVAKHRAIYTLLHVNLPVESRAKNPVTGLQFDFLKPLPGQPVTTGHERGVITMNLEESDDAIREANRQRLHEPYRTLLGHFRHELGHYHWWRWYETGQADPKELDAVRAVFGHEHDNYQSAMDRYYRSGPPAGWEQTFISAYAAMHPWEDWAESWAHYFHILDGLQTIDSFSLDGRPKRFEGHMFDEKAVQLPAAVGRHHPKEFLNMLHRWVFLTPAINELASSLGQRNLYPFVLSREAARKLHLIHVLVKKKAVPPRKGWFVWGG